MNDAGDVMGCGLASDPRLRVWSPVLCASLVVSMTLLAATVFFWELMDSGIRFLVPTLAAGAWLAYPVVGLWSAYHAIKWTRSTGPQALVPLGMNLLVLGIVLIVPFTDIMLELDFRSNLQKRMEVVGMVECGALASLDRRGTQLVALPPGYREVSRGGGEILVERNGGRTVVFFYTYRGVLGRRSGFMYRSDDTDPGVEAFGDRLIQVIRKEPHWHFTAF